MFLYDNCKVLFNYEVYLDILPESLRCLITRFRISAHSLRIQTGRYARNRIQRNERYCQCCNVLDVEDEYHFIIICPCHLELRKRFISKIFYSFPSMYKCVTLMQTTDKIVLQKLARYIKEALILRNGIINDT